MPNISVPSTHIGVVVLVPRDPEAEADVRVVGLTSEDSEHGSIAEAISALAAAACDITDDLIPDPDAEAATDPADAEEEEEEDDETKPH
jgi:hypothetical protein